MPHETLMTFCVPNHARRAGREVGLVHPVNRCAAAARTPTAGAATSSGAASSGSTAASSSATAAPTSSAASAGREGGRGECETSNQQSRAQRRKEAAALLAFELKKSTHRQILQI
jgi:hypothetical protein